MPTTNVNIRMDEELKRDMERTCYERESVAQVRAGDVVVRSMEELEEMARE